jgi:homoaconitase/3-isopropylmalate dehydratase large subunit
MGTLTEEIFSRRLGRPVHAGEIVVAPVDYAMAHDVTGPLAIEAFRKLGVALWDPERVIMVFDHILPANTVASAGLHKIVRDFADEFGVTHVFQEGICHQLMVEKGFIRPGGIVVGADSHSTTYGALGCFSAGFGSTDIAVTFATGKTWFRIPETIRINLRGQLPPGIFPTSP